MFHNLMSLLIFMTVGCASKQFYGDSAARYNGPEGKSVKTLVVWTKNKPNSVDMMVSFFNEYPHSVLVRNFLLNTAGLKVGPNDSTILELQPGQTQEKLFIFKRAGKKFNPRHDEDHDGSDRKGTFSFSVFDDVNKPLPGFTQTYQLCPVDAIVDCAE